MFCGDARGHAPCSQQPTAPATAAPPSFYASPIGKLSMPIGIGLDFRDDLRLLLPPHLSLYTPAAPRPHIRTHARTGRPPARSKRKLEPAMQRSLFLGVLLSITLAAVCNGSALRGLQQPQNATAQQRPRTQSPSSVTQPANATTATPQNESVAVNATEAGKHGGCWGYGCGGHYHHHHHGWHHGYGKSLVRCCCVVMWVVFGMGSLHIHFFNKPTPINNRPNEHSCRLAGAEGPAAGGGYAHGERGAGGERHGARRPAPVGRWQPDGQRHARRGAARQRLRGQLHHREAQCVSGL